MSTEQIAIPPELARAAAAASAAAGPPGLSNTQETSIVSEAETEPLSDVLRIDQAQLHRHLDQVVRDSVEETLNGPLDAEADQLCGAKRYERSPDRVDTRAGSYTRTLQTRVGEVELKMPRLRKLPFETRIIERYRRRESSVEEALVEMYLAGVSVRRVEDITEALWGTRVSPSTVSELNKRIYAQINEWRERPIEGEHPYVYLDGIWLKRCWGGEVKNVAVLVAVGVGRDGFRQVLGVMEGAKEDRESWRAFLRHLKGRGLKGVRLVVSDKGLGLGKTAQLVREGVGETLAYMAFPREHWRCLRTNNPLERVMRELRRRTRVVGAFPDGESALMLVAARLRHVAASRWGSRKYLDMSRLYEPQEVPAAVGERRRPSAAGRRQDGAGPRQTGVSARGRLENVRKSLDTTRQRGLGRPDRRGDR